MSPVRVRVDPDLCVGHGRCYALGPDVYSADDYGHCVIREPDVAPEHVDQARIGAANCPEDAITVVED